MTVSPTRRVRISMDYPRALDAAAGLGKSHPL